MRYEHHTRVHHCHQYLIMWSNTLIGYMRIPNKETCDRPIVTKITDDWKSLIEDQDFTLPYWLFHNIPRHTWLIFHVVYCKFCLVNIMECKKERLSYLFFESIHYKISEYTLYDNGAQYPISIICMSQQKVDFQEPDVRSLKWMRIYGSSSYKNVWFSHTQIRINVPTIGSGYNSRKFKDK